MLSRDPSPFPGISRRRVLIGGGRGLALLAALGLAGTACETAPPPEPDPLEQQAELARHDSELAAAAAKAAPPSLAPALTQVAEDRGRHFTALSAEVVRLSGKPASSTSSTTPTTTSAPAMPPPTVADVVAALRSSADSATKLAPTLSGYRAGLLGSIAASCVTSYTVALPPGKAGQ